MSLASVTQSSTELGFNWIVIFNIVIIFVSIYSYVGQKNKKRKKILEIIHPIWKCDPIDISQ